MMSFFEHVVVLCRVQCILTQGVGEKDIFGMMLGLTPDIVTVPFKSIRSL